jgi:hypothetical protein
MSNRTRREFDFASGPAIDIFSITPSDATPLAETITQIVCTGTAGNICVMTAAGNKQTVPIAAGGAYDLAILQVFATGTTATGLVGLV